VINHTNKCKIKKNFFFVIKQANKQMCFKKLFCFFVIFASLTSNISVSRQNIKNLVGNLFGKGSSYLYTKNLLSSFKTEGASQVTYRQTLKNDLTLVQRFY